MSKISMIVSVWNDSLKSNIQTADFGLYQMYKHSASPRVYKSDINLLCGLYILHIIDAKNNAETLVNLIILRLMIG